MFSDIHKYPTENKVFGLGSNFFCPKNAITLFHVAMNTVYIYRATQKKFTIQFREKATLRH